MARTEITSRGIIIQDNKVLLIHRRKNGDEYFVFPGGGVEDDESPEEAVLREIFEETGLSVLSLEKAFEIIDINQHPVHLFFASVEDGTPVLVGEEKDVSCDQDWYNPEWFDVSILNQKNVYPIAARCKLLEDIKTKNLPG